MGLGFPPIHPVDFFGPQNELNRASLRTLSKNRSFSFVDEAGWKDLFQRGLVLSLRFYMGLVRPYYSLRGWFRGRGKCSVRVVLNLPPLWATRIASHNGRCGHQKSGPATHQPVRLTYGWWFRNPVKSPVDMVNIICKYPIIYQFSYLVGLVQDFIHQQYLGNESLSLWNWNRQLVRIWRVINSLAVESV